MRHVAYNGRALWTPPARKGKGFRPGWILVAGLALGIALWVEKDAVAKSVPYRALFTVKSVDVQGETYLTDSEVRALAGLAPPVACVRLALRRARPRPL